MTKILLIISLAINVILYFWLVDVWQYRNYVDKTIELWKKFAESDEFKEMKENTKDLWKQVIDNANKKILQEEADNYY